MYTLFEEQEKKRGLNKGLLIGALIGLVAIAVLIFIAMQRPSMQDQMAAVLADAHREGSPEFDEITKDIIISTGDNTVESPNAFGRISMFISGNIRNKGTKTINGLEVNVAVVDTFNQTLKEKRVLVVPTQVEQLGPNEVIPITLSLDGFEKKDDRANIRWKVTAIRTP
ncbi:MAG TPA: hypothetical protein VK612_06705 [Pyrinomonadaceae bacterium]|nr:hypothetical protein [Pyrinomonadaceae bacterium]